MLWLCRMLLGMRLSRMFHRGCWMLLLRRPWWLHRTLLRCWMFNRGRPLLLRRLRSLYWMLRGSLGSSLLLWAGLRRGLLRPRSSLRPLRRRLRVLNRRRMLRLHRPLRGRRLAFWRRLYVLLRSLARGRRLWLLWMRHRSRLLLLRRLLARRGLIAHGSSRGRLVCARLRLIVVRL